MFGIYLLVNKIFNGLLGKEGYKIIGCGKYINFLFVCWGKGLKMMLGNGKEKMIMVFFDLDIFLW